MKGKRIPIGRRAPLLKAVLFTVVILAVIFGFTYTARAFSVGTSSSTAYFDEYNGTAWADQLTPFHSTSTGEIAYCLAEKKTSPANNSYNTGNILGTYSARVRNGLQIILENGYPLGGIPNGLDANKARYATANAIRFWLSENGDPNFYNNEDFSSYSDAQLRSMTAAGTYGQIGSKMRASSTANKPVLQFAIELLIAARSQRWTDQVVSFSPLNMSFNGSYFVGTTVVSLNNIKYGYTLNTSGLPAGSSVSGYSGNNGDTLTIYIPANYDTSGAAFSISATGYDDVSTVNMYAVCPTNSSYQAVAYVTDGVPYKVEVANGSVAVSTPAIPDLAPTITTNKPVYEAGETITYTAYIQNQGKGWCDWEYTRNMNGDVPTSALNPWDAYSFSWTAAAPVNTSDTVQSTSITADIYNYRPELNENNNTASVSYTVKAGLPDLVISSLITDKATYNANDTVTVTAVVRNQGLTPAYNAVVRLSSSPSATAQDQTVSLPPGGSQTLYYTFTAPVYSTTTTMTLTTTADATGVVTESNEGNNSASKNITINPGLPDLVVTSLTTDKGAYESGDTVIVTAVVKNQGYTAAGSFETRLVSNPTATSQDKSCNLAAGATTTLTYTFVAPTYLTATAMALTATADANGVIAELSESNNTKTASITINALKPDLTVTSANITDWYAGMEVLVSAKVSNFSLQPVPSVMVRLTAGSTTVNEMIPVPGNGSNLAIFRFRVPSSPGTVNITIKVDPDNAIGEINESNNQLSTSQAVVAIPAATFVDPDEPALESYFQQRAKTVPALPATAASNSHSWQEIRLESGSYNIKTYWATLSTAFTTQPDPRIAQANKPGVMESGFGVTVTAKTTLSTNYDHPEKLIGPQMMWLFYPESAYGQAVQWPTLHESMTVQSSTTGSTSTITWQYPVNPVSVSGNRLHYTPLWFPDNAAYATLAQAFYGWSPLGQMIDYATSSVTIQGDMYDRITVVRAR